MGKENHAMQGGKKKDKKKTEGKIRDASETFQEKKD